MLRLAAMPGLSRLVGCDTCHGSLARLRQRLNGAELRLASVLDPPADLAGFDCAALVEVIEHLDPSHLSKLERAVCRTLRPAKIVVTTPNAEFKPAFGRARPQVPPPGPQIRMAARKVSHLGRAHGSSPWL